MFEHFIYMFGAVSFAIAVPATAFWLVSRIEHPRRTRK